MQVQVQVHMQVRTRVQMQVADTGAAGAGAAGTGAAGTGAGRAAAVRPVRPAGGRVSRPGQPPSSRWRAASSAVPRSVREPKSRSREMPPSG
ncbi:hypothetical protein GCM10023329_06170 [Streptomyces sanyensis]|uniref:Uncharacterized protein n=1 Tax=Streptomyces sanyensis TaxID=568869 RepID=A0ABP8ZQV1_9ACTN